MPSLRESRRTRGKQRVELQRSRLLVPGDVSVADAARFGMATPWPSDSAKHVPGDFYGYTSASTSRSSGCASVTPCSSSTTAFARFRSSARFSMISFV